MSKPNNLIGQTFGRLTVIDRAENDKHGHTRWLCQCECGNQKVIAGSSLKKGLTQSCGCLKKEKLNQYNLEHTQDETGKRYGRLTVLYRDTNPKHSKDGRAMWVCQCDCGNQVVVAGKLLRNGHTQSCGCLMLEKSSQTGKITGPMNGGQLFKDLTGQKFGKLTVLKRGPNLESKLATWQCQCDCGSIVTVRGSSLRNGQTTSCGCIKSKGEENIAKILTIYQINYNKEYVVSSIKQNHNYRFDFAILDNQNNIKYLIEYDGSQHFITNNSGWNTKEALEKTQERDIIKNQWCIDNNIPLIRIPYWHLQDLCVEDLLLETSKFIVGKECDEVTL